MPLFVKERIQLNLLLIRNAEHSVLGFGRVSTSYVCPCSLWERCFANKEFRAKALKVARWNIDIERERTKKIKSVALVKTLIGESFNPFLDQGSQYIKNVSKELLMHPTFKSVFFLVWRVSFMVCCSNCRRR